MSEKKSFVEFECDDSGNVSGVVILDDSGFIFSGISLSFWDEIKDRYGVDEVSGIEDLKFAVNSYFRDLGIARVENVESELPVWLRHW